MWFIHATGHDLAIKRNDVLTQTTTLKNLENILLNGKKTDTKGHILYDTIYVKYPE